MFLKRLSSSLLVGRLRCEIMGQMSQKIALSRFRAMCLISADGYFVDLVLTRCGVECYFSGRPLRTVDQEFECAKPWQIKSSTDLAIGEHNAGIWPGTAVTPIGACRALPAGAFTRFGSQDRAPSALTSPTDQITKGRWQYCPGFFDSNRRPGIWTLTRLRAVNAESRHCYKRLPKVLSQHKSSVRILHTLTPIGVAMAGENESDPYKD